MKRYVIQGQENLFQGIKDQERLMKFTSSLLVIRDAINWEGFRHTIESHIQKRKPKCTGRPGYDPVTLFKIVFLQKSHGLSDEETEFMILDRFSFREFIGLSSGDSTPDRNTIWRFRERLGEQGVRALFDQVNQLLLQKKVMLQGGSIVDARIVEVPKQRNTKEENKCIKNGKRPSHWQDNPSQDRQKDTDARWTSKGNKSFYGYKNHIKVDRKTKLIKNYQVTSANLHDSQTLFELMDSSSDRELYADSAYASQETSEFCKNHKIRNYTHERAYRNRPLTEKQKKSNHHKSKIRCRVEHVFGAQAYSMKSSIVRTVGITRARVQIGLDNLIYNLVRTTQIGLPLA